MATPLLNVKGLETQFKTPDGIIHAVNGVSFSLNEGETLGIVGESGCGKSVTMLSILRLIPMPPGKIVAGEAFFREQDLLKMSVEEIRHVRGAQIAMVFQDPMTSLNPVLTIGVQLEEPLMFHLNMTKRQAKSRAAELLQMVGIPNAKDRLPDYPHQFSGGMRQRVMIAMALSCDPQILIADEPTTALDVTIQAQIIELVKRLRDELGMAIIWITHDLGLVAGMADRESGVIIDTAGSWRFTQFFRLLGTRSRIFVSRVADPIPVEQAEKEIGRKTAPALGQRTGQQPKTQGNGDHADRLLRSAGAVVFACAPIH